MAAPPRPSGQSSPYRYREGLARPLAPAGASDVQLYCTSECIRDRGTCTGGRIRRVFTDYSGQLWTSIGAELGHKLSTLPIL